MAFCTTVKPNAIKLYQMPPINLAKACSRVRDRRD
jgi:hypothetical protein